jgi:hypothetical protein
VIDRFDTESEKFAKCFGTPCVGSHLAVFGPVLIRLMYMVVKCFSCRIVAKFMSSMCMVILHILYRYIIYYPST